MAVDKRSGGSAPKWASRETTPGIKIDSGPFVGIVKNNADPARLGRLQVWIPDLGGEESVEANWYTVSYASPFFGSTQGSPGNSEGLGQQTYGFWAVPPDLNNLVLVTFVMGDPSRGYWFACIPNTSTQLMTPGLARPFFNTRIEVSNSFGKNRNIPAENVYLPASEVNLESLGKDKDPDYLNLNRFIIDHQAEIVCRQGLETDPVRGSVTSSSQRESPSGVFGISTPGRFTTDTADMAPGELTAKLKQGKEGITISELQNYPFRKGGHSFVMDDGDIFGNDQLVRLRSSGGHQILLHDKENIIYIGNSKGNTWVELTPNGSINIYSGESVNIRSTQDLNFHADRNINFHAGDTFKVYAEKNILTETQNHIATAVTKYNMNAGKIGVKSSSSLTLQAVTGGWKCSGELMLKGSKIYMNTAGKVPADVDKNDKFEFYKKEDSILNSTTKRYERKPNKFESISPFTPTHEPWIRETGPLKKVDGSTVSSVQQTPKST